MRRHTKDALWQLLAFIGVLVLAVMAGTVLVGAMDDSFQRGYLAGRASVLNAKPHHDCLAWWFNNDPVRADRNLSAACAARKDR